MIPFIELNNTKSILDRKHKLHVDLYQTLKVKNLLSHCSAKQLDGIISNLIIQAKHNNSQAVRLQSLEMLKKIEKRLNYLSNSEFSKILKKTDSSQLSNLYDSFFIAFGYGSFPAQRIKFYVRSFKNNQSEQPIISKLS